MACYRLTFQNQQAFETVVESTPVHGDDRSNVCVALIYRVANGFREAEPLHRVGGGPIQVLAVNEQTAVDIVNEVLKEVTGSRLISLAECGPHPISLPLLRPVLPRLLSQDCRWIWSRARARIECPGHEPHDLSVQRS